MIVIGFLSHDQSTIGKTFSKVLPFVHDGGPFGTVPELLFEKKGLIPALQQLLIPICDSMDAFHHFAHGSYNE
jgi:hypothetical protein